MTKTALNIRTGCDILDESYWYRWATVDLLRWISCWDLVVIVLYGDDIAWVSWWYCVGIVPYRVGFMLLSYLYLVFIVFIYYIYIVSLSCLNRTCMFNAAIIL